MTIDTTSASFVEDYTYATKKYYKTMEKYRGFFNEFFEYNVRSFVYDKIFNDGRILTLTSFPEGLELFVGTEGLEDCPLFTNFNNVNSGSGFFFPNYDLNDVKHNKFREVFEKRYGMNFSFFITEKKHDYYEVVLWEFSRISKQVPITKRQISILQTCLDKAPLLKACHEQFKKEMFPIIENKDLYRTNLKDFKKELYDTQEHIVAKDTNTIRKALLNAGIIEERDVMLDRVKFTPSERQVLDCYLQGMSAKEIGKAINRSYKTVEEHVNIIKAKLNVKKKAKSSH
jgi:DNA-binding CsgD family transcriptional regulator